MKKITILLAFLAAFSWQGMAQTTLYLTTYGGSFASEKWVEITDGPNGTGNVLWAQGNGTYGDGEGTVTDSIFTIVDGTTYYISCYDRYADGWDGTKYEINTASGRAGTVVASNGGVSPDDAADTDSGSSWETRALERESEESFSYTPPSCALPSTLTATNISATTADLGWTENGSATSWDIEWSTSGFTQGAGTMVTGTTTNPHSLTGLTANTSYDFYVRADCGGSGTSTWVGPTSFTTLPGAHTLPLSEDFEAGMSNFGNASGNDVDWVINTFYFHGGAQSVHNAYTSSDENILHETGILDLSLNTAPILEFWHIAKTEGGWDKCFVEVSTDGGATYIAIPSSAYLGSAGDYATKGYFHEDSYGTWGTSTGTPDNATWWKKETFSLAGYLVSNVRVRFRLTGDSSSERDGWFLDDILISEPSCPDPSTLTAANITATTADLGWTENGSATTWDVEWDTTGFTQGAGTMVTGTTTNPHSLTGLTDNTSYDFYVRADCGGSGTSSWVGPFHFTTLCGVIGTPFTESFDATSLPSCWSQSATTGGPWVFGNPGISWNTTGCSAPSEHTGNGGNMVSLDFSGTDVGVILELPDVDVSSLTVPNLTFWYYMCNVSYTPVNKLFVEAWDGSSWVLVDSNITGTVGWEKQSFDLTGYTYGATLLKIRLRAESGGSSSAYYGDAGIDDVAIDETPSCLAPSVLTAINITTTAADLGWTENGSSTTWDIEWDTLGFTQGSGTMVTGTTTNPHSLTGLTDNTSYDFYVRADCGGSGTSSWAGPFNFSTLCNVYSTPYAEGFESGFTDQASVGGCLSQESENGTQTWTANNSLTSYNRSARTGSFNAYLKYGNEDWIFVPINLVSGISYTAEIYARQDGSTTSNSNVMIAYGATATAAGMTDTIAAPVGIDATYQLITGTFTPSSSGVFYIGFKGYMNFNPYYISIDDIAVFETPTCLAPTAQTATNITASAADLGWTESASASIWDIEWDTTGFTQGTGTMVTGTTTNPYLLSGLTAETTYDFYVRADCGGGDLSTWVGPMSFSTLCATISTFPFTESFDATSPTINCWMNDQVVGAGNWGLSTAGAAGGAVTAPFSGTHNVAFVSQSGTNDPITRLVSPSFDLTGVTNPYMSFYYAQEEWFGDQNYTRVLYRTSSSGTWTEIWSDSTNVDAWAQVGLHLPNPSATYQIAFEGINNWARRNVIDEMVIGSSIAMAETMNVDSNATCFGFADGGASVVVTGGVAPLTYNWSNGSDSASAVNLLAGTYNLTVTDLLGDIVSNSVVITEPAEIVLDLGNDTSICMGSAMTIDAGSVGSYLWDDASTIQTRSVATASAGMHKYWVEITVGVCSVSDTIEVTVVAPVDPDLGVDTTLCMNASYTLDAGTFSSYSWDDATTAQTRVVTASSVGTTSYWVEVSNGACVTSDTIDVTVVAPVVPDLGNDTTICYATSLTLDAGSFSSYVWDDASAMQTRTVNGNNPGMVNYYVTTSDANGCAASDSIKVTSNNELMVDLGNDTTVCLNGALTLDAGSYTSYLWDDASTMQTRSVASSVSGTTIYSVTVTDAIGCTNNDAIVIDVANPLMPNLGNDTSICINGRLVLDAADGLNFTSYLWDDASTMAARTVTGVIPNTTTTYYVTTIDTNKCVGSDSIDVTIDNIVGITPDLGNDTIICIGANLTLDAGPGTIFSTYLWDDASAMQTRAITGAAVGSINYYVTTEDLNGCASSDSILVTISPIVELANDTTLCVNASLTVDAGSFSSYMWSTGATSQTITPSTAVSGLSTYFVAVTDSNSCVSSDTMKLTVVDPVVPNLGNDTTLCLNASLTLDAGSFNGYLWDDASTMQTRAVVSSTSGVTNYYVTTDDANGCAASDSIMVTIVDPIVPNLGNDTTLCLNASLTLDAGAFTSYLWDDASTAQTRVASGATAGTVNYYVTTSDVNGCEASDSIVVVTDPAVVVDLGNDTLVCLDAVLTLDAGSYATYTWDDASTSQTRALANSTAGIATYFVEVATANNCIGSDTIMVTVVTPVVPAIGNDTSICMNASLTLDAGTFISYLWDDASTAQTMVVPSATAGITNHFVTTNDANGCAASDSIMVTVFAPMMPNLGNDTTICVNASLTLDAGTFISYLWDDASIMQTRSVLSTTPGVTNYYVTTDDANGCVGNDSIHVTVVAPMMPTLGNDTLICMGATLTLDAGFFTTYMWDDATAMQTRMVSGTTAGMVNYYVTTSDANGCIGSDSIMVTTDVAISVDLGTDTLVCMNSSFLLDAGSASSYVWDDASTMRTRPVMTTTAGATDFSVEVSTANGCTATDTIMVTVDAAVNVDLGSDTLICNGESYTIDAGPGFTTYMWNNGTNMQSLTVMSNGAASTNYSVVVANANGCTGTDAVIITTTDPVMVDLGADTNIWDVNATTFTLDAGVGFNAYMWNDGSTNQTLDVTPTADGTFSVEVTDNNGCTGSDTVVVDFVLSVNSFNASTLKMYPNPAADHVTIELSNFNNVNEVSVTFISLTGQTVMTQKIGVSGNSYVGTFDVSRLATGTYFVQFEANGEVVVRQFVIK